MRWRNAGGPVIARSSRSLDVEVLVSLGGNVMFPHQLFGFKTVSSNPFTASKSKLVF